MRDLVGSVALPLGAANQLNHTAAACAPFQLLVDKTARTSARSTAAVTLFDAQPDPARKDRDLQIVSRFDDVTVQLPGCGRSAMMLIRLPRKFVIRGTRVRRSSTAAANLT